MADFEIIDSETGEVRDTAETWLAGVRLSDYWLAKTRRAHNVRPRQNEVIDIRDAEPARRRLFAR